MNFTLTQIILAFIIGGFVGYSINYAALQMHRSVSERAKEAIRVMNKSNQGYMEKLQEMKSEIEGKLKEGPITEDDNLGSKKDNHKPIRPAKMVQRR